MAAMSVIGIDFGNESCYVAVAKAGGIETIANDYSLRGTPSCVAFSSKNRILGVAAKNQMVTNMKNTVTCFKRLLGRKFNDPHVQRELPHLPFKVEERGDGGVGVRVRYLNEEQVFSPEQLTAMLFTKLKESSTIALQTQVNDCVISVPSYFTNTERKALLDSAAVAGLNVLRLMNETTATALAYGIYKQNLPTIDEKPRNVIFVDMGQASLQVAACAFNLGKLRVLATASDPEIGGRDIDFLLAEYFCKDFQTRYKIDARNNPRAFLRLLQEVERLKKQMSANSTKLPLNIECFIDEKDVTGEIQRTTMESLCSDLFKKVEECLKYCLHMSKLRLDDIHSVEVVGGSSRIPAVKSIIESIFGKPASTTLNQDEAVSRGAALQCAMLSPAVRVREFSVTDVQPYSVRLAWDADAGEDGEMEVFQTNHAAPFSKLLTFYRREPFYITAFYGEQVPFPDSNIGKWRVNDITPTSEGESQKIKIKVRVNLHGIVTVASASLVEKRESGDGGKDAAESQEETPMEHNGAEQTNGEGNGSDLHNEEMTDVDKKDKSKDKKQMVKLVELPIKAEPCGYTQQEVNGLTEQECSMQAVDRQEKERVDARNALEEYMYDVRGKVCDGGSLKLYVPAAEAGSLSKLLQDTENWLYEEGEDCNRQVYTDKLNELRGLGEPIQQRSREWELCPIAIQEFSIAIERARKVSYEYQAGLPKYSHITEQEVKKLIDTVESACQWVEQTRHTLLTSSKEKNPSPSSQQINTEKQNFQSTVNPIVNKPKPKEKTPPPTGDPQPQGENQPQASQPTAQSDQPVDQMDVE